MKKIDDYANKAVECINAAMKCRISADAKVFTEAAQAYATLSLSLQQKEANDINSRTNPTDSNNPTDTNINEMQKTLFQIQEEAVRLIDEIESLAEVNERRIEEDGALRSLFFP